MTQLHSALSCLQLSDAATQKVPGRSKPTSDAEIRAQAAENRVKQQSQQGLHPQPVTVKTEQGAEAQQVQRAATLKAQQAQQGAAGVQVASASKVGVCRSLLNLIMHRRHSRT